MFRGEYLVEKYINDINICKESYDDVFQELEKELGIYMISPGHVSSSYMKIILENCRYVSQERGIDCTEDDYVIDVYTVPCNEKTRTYFDEMDEKELLIIFERRTQYLECASSSLFCKIKKMKGITPEDFEEKNQNLWDYLSMLEVEGSI